MNRILPALSSALEEWRRLATDADVAQVLFQFDASRERLTRLRQRLERLRLDPPRFDATDLAAVLDELSGAQSMRQQIIEGNDIEVLVPTLRSFLFNPEESLEEKLRVYPASIRYAGLPILAELWGWTHIERWPIYTQRALSGLRLLGWPLPKHDYFAFAHAFEDLRVFYQQDQPVTQLPLNLEISHFLNWVADSAGREAIRQESGFALSGMPPGGATLRRRSYAVREFGAPYDATLTPLYAWPDRPLPAPTLEHLAAAEERIRSQLALPPHIIERAVAHLLAGRHLILTGAPGTGKSHLAVLLAEEIFGYYPMLVTATAEWSTFDVVGGLVPVVGDKGNLSYEVRPGVIYDALRQNWLLAEDGTVRRDTNGSFLRSGTLHEGRQWPGVWLVIDELNRADVDKAFGELFTALESGMLRVPRAGTDASLLIPLPRDFRILATLNTRDRHFLFTLSDALKRRFAFLEIEGAGDPEQERRILLRRALDDVTARTLPVKGELLTHALDSLFPGVQLIRAFHPLGSAPVMAVLRYVAAASYLAPRAIEELVQEAVIAEILPQLESLRELPLRLLSLLFRGHTIEAVEVLIDYVKHVGLDSVPLTIIRNLAALASQDLHNRATGIALQSHSSLDAQSDVLAILTALRDGAERIPVPEWPLVAARLEVWQEERH